MRTEFIRFQIDSALRARADDVCTRLGLDLPSVLRAVVTQIARDGALPLALGAPGASATAVQPVADPYEGRLWSALRPQLRAELAIGLLIRFVADCSAALDDAADLPAPDAALIERLSADRAAALALRNGLDVTDAAAVERVIAAYGVRGQGG